MNLPVIAPLDGEEWLLTDLTTGATWPASIPGSVHLDLIRAGAIDDPFYRENEALCAWIGEHDWRYERRFDLEPKLRGRRHYRLRFDGLDTLATVHLNGQLVLTSENMHRRYDLDVTGLLSEHGNHLSVDFRSPLTEIRRRQSERRLPGWYAMMCVEGAGWLRKQLSNFGWDWGPSLVTAGIWRNAYLVGHDGPLLTHVEIEQQHEAATVRLKVRVHTTAAQRGDLIVSAELRDPLGHEQVVDGPAGESLALAVRSPQLWWPNGMGDQPLYTLRTTLRAADGEPLAVDERRIGLRTIRLHRDIDEDGQTFGFSCNGVPFFAKGANWIPADAVVGRVSLQRLRELVADAAAANMNMLRVWGGGVYEDDAFYDACDEAGICVWQDAAFACVTFPAFDPSFLHSVREELADNVRRLAHHPSLALWCGNNELEMGLVAEEWSGTGMAWRDYTPVMDELLRDIVAELDPARPYWPASPHTPGERRSDANSPHAGDAHLWQVWHGGQAPSWYRTSGHRFVSEFGFQSFPHPATVASFTRPEDRDVASPVMDAHQKARAAGASGSAEIARQLVGCFRSPADWDGYIWQTQLLQASAVTTGIEHWRRGMDRTRGTLYWQLNDCWPGPSWSSIDADGRWKALHYAVRRAYAPVMISLIADTQRTMVALHLTNDHPVETSVTVDWWIYHTDGSSLGSGSIHCVTPAMCNRELWTLDVRQLAQLHGERNILVFTTVRELPDQVSVASFVAPKHLSLRDPHLSMSRRGSAVTVRAERPALWVWLDSADPSVRFSDNFFAMMPGERTIDLSQRDATLALCSLHGTYRDATTSRSVRATARPNG